MKRHCNFLKTYRVKRLKHGWNWKLPPRMYFLVQSPPHVWISRAVNPPSREIFQHAFRRGGVDFFWNNPIHRIILYYLPAYHQTLCFWLRITLYCLPWWCIHKLLHKAYCLIFVLYIWIYFFRSEYIQYIYIYGRL